MKYISFASLLFFSLPLFSQPPDIRKVQSAIVNAIVTKDSNSLRSFVDDKFVLVHADGSVQNKSGFIHAADRFGKDDALSIMLIHESHIDHHNLVIVKGICQQQWLESDYLMRSKIPYTDTYHKVNGKWMLISSYINDIGEHYYALADTNGMRKALTERYRLLDMSVMEKNLPLHLSLKTGDFSTIDQYGNTGSAQFMRNRSWTMFTAMRDSIYSNNSIEKIEMSEDTIKATVVQTFKRRQMMAGNKVRKVESSARQRESWMLTRDGWKLVFVDQVKPLSRVVDGIKTDPSKPFDPNDPAFRN